MKASAIQSVKPRKALAWLVEQGFIGSLQQRAILQGMQGEERRFFFDKVLEIKATIDAMPKTYQTDGQGNEAIVHLHYFIGSADWYIIEKDCDLDGQGQVQAFGLADLFRDGGELGYISLKEATGVGAELDFWWTPKTLKQVRKERGVA